VAVIGGGVVGLCCARELRRRGLDVVVVERDRCGEAASLGNAGWVTPALSAPIPAPGVMGHALRWMLSRDSPLLVRPRLDPAFLRWSWHFWRSQAAARHRTGARALVALNARTLELFDELRDDGVRFEMGEQGLLFLARTEEGLAEYERSLTLLASLGYRGGVRRLAPPELREHEPSVGVAAVGGLMADAERHVRPESLCAGLLERLRHDGVEILEGSEVGSLGRHAGGWRLGAGSEELVVDRVVVAAGAWTSRVLAALRIRLPLEAAKGYSVTMAVGGPRLRGPVYLVESKVAVTPFSADVRVAGTLELAGLDLTIDRRRLEAVARAPGEYLTGWRPGPRRLEWSGLRPLAPDGLPYIGAVPGQDGLFVATGHGMLGVTLAPATAAALAPVVAGAGDGRDLAPFRVGRF
jgi:D-amino-acid dehydrogenase